MPLIATSTVPQIGSIYLTSDGTITGTPAYVEWPDWQSRDNPLVAETVALDGTSSLEIEPIGRTGIITLVIRNCYAVLYLALRTQKNLGGHLTAILPHPIEPSTLSLDVEWRSLKGADSAWLPNEPVENSILSFWCHGAI